MATHSSILAWRIPWTEETIHGITESWERLVTGTTQQSHISGIGWSHRNRLRSPPQLYITRHTLRPLPFHLWLIDRSLEAEWFTDGSNSVETGT